MSEQTHKAKQMRRRRARTRRVGLITALGYTIVEVMMAMAVLSVGATGVIAMQKAALIGNVRARNLTAATAIASTWIERLRVDARRWKAQPSGLSTIGSTTWLKIVGNDYPSVVGKEATWIRADPVAADAVSPAFDVRGADIAANSANPAFCAHMRLEQILPNLIRVEVRVVWLRNHNTHVTGDYAGTLDAKNLCADDAALILDMNDSSVGKKTARGRYHFVYLTTAVMRNDD